MRVLSLLDSARRVACSRLYLHRCTAVGRRPRVYGRPRIINQGSMEIGDRFILFNHIVTSELVTHPQGRIEIGDGVFINHGASLSAHKLIRIGNGCQIGAYACMMDNDYHQVENRERLGDSRPIVLGENVWLGVRVVILKGVNVGNNAVIGAGSVVTDDVPANTVVGGVPAKTIRSFEPDNS